MAGVKIATPGVNWRSYGQQDFSDCLSMIEITIMNGIKVYFYPLSLSIVLDINTSASIVGSSIHARLQS
jgi:hypothetical protein